jgi:hypothetical protein
MKKLILMFAVALVSCETKNVTITETNASVDGRSLKTYQIEGCEYLGYSVGHENGVLTHKGNCKNPIHNNK